MRPNPYEPPKSDVVPFLESGPRLRLEDLVLGWLLPALAVTPVGVLWVVATALSEQARYGPIVYFKAAAVFFVLGLAIQLVVGTLLSWILRSLGARAFLWVVIPYVLPVLPLALVRTRTASDWIDVAIWVGFALVLGFSSWYFLVRRVLKLQQRRSEAD